MVILFLKIITDLHWYSFNPSQSFGLKNILGLFPYDPLRGLKFGDMIVIKVLKQKLMQ